MPIRVSKSAISRSRGAEVPLLGDVVVPAIGGFYSSGPDPVPTTVFDTMLNAWLTEGDDHFGIATGRAQVLKPGVYLAQATMETFASDGADVGPMYVAIQANGSYDNNITSVGLNLFSLAGKQFFSSQSQMLWFEHPGEVWLTGNPQAPNPAARVFNARLVLTRLGEFGATLYLDENGS